MVSSASRATVDLTQGTPSLLDSMSRLGLEAKEFKFVLFADENQIDPKPFQHLYQQYHDLEWEFKPFNAMQNPEPYLETQLEADNLLMHPHTKCEAGTASDVKEWPVYGWHGSSLSLSTKLAATAHVPGLFAPWKETS